MTLRVLQWCSSLVLIGRIYSDASFHALLIFLYSSKYQTIPLQGTSSDMTGTSQGWYQCRVFNLSRASIFGSSTLYPQFSSMKGGSFATCTKLDYIITLPYIGRLERKRSHGNWGLCTRLFLSIWSHLEPSCTEQSLPALLDHWTSIRASTSHLLGRWAQIKSDWSDHWYQQLTDIIPSPASGHTV